MTAGTFVEPFVRAVPVRAMSRAAKEREAGTGSLDLTLAGGAVGELTKHAPSVSDGGAMFCTQHLARKWVIRPDDG
jgi:hypothetical protein